MTTIGKKRDRMRMLHSVVVASTIVLATSMKFFTEASPIIISQNINDSQILSSRYDINKIDSTQHNQIFAQEARSLGRRVTRSNMLDDTNVLQYLRRYGYMSKKHPKNPGSNNDLVSEESFTSAIRNFQRFAGINETGKIDSETIELMQTPRCGNSDYETAATSNNFNGMPSILHKIGVSIRRNQTTKKRRKRYALQGSKWRRQELTYRISQYPTRFLGKKQDVDAQIEKAFGLWSNFAPIDFIVKKEGKVHIDIRFASGEHGDGDAFDGPGNTLAHAYFPQYGGDAHFDDQEYWTIDSYAGTNIFQVAAHELGHSLGLGHSNVREALMAPFYQKYKPNFKLNLDDILAIQALYGEKRLLQNPNTQNDLTHSFTSTTSTTTIQPGPSSSIPSTTSSIPTHSRPNGFVPDQGHKETNDDESALSPDLVGNGIGGSGPSSDDALAFQGAGTTNRISPNPVPSMPADLCQDSQIDTATRTEDGNSYVFKGNFYWQLTSDGLAKGFPRHIATDWDNLPGSLDASFTWADGKTFFFKGNKYWRFRNQRRDIGYPKLISAGFAGIPDDIDAAFVWSGNGRTYIFKGSQYWRYDSKADPPVSSEYPRSIKVWRGVPSYINAALKWENNVTYFFKGNQYYRFNDKEFRVELRGRPAFPRPTAEWWFGCIGSNLALRRAMPEIDHQQQAERRNYQMTVNNLRPDPMANEWALLPQMGATKTNNMGTHINDGTDERPSLTDQTNSPDLSLRGREFSLREAHDHSIQSSGESRFTTQPSSALSSFSSTSAIYPVISLTSISFLLSIQSLLGLLKNK